MSSNRLVISEIDYKGKVKIMLGDLIVILPQNFKCKEIIVDAGVTKNQFILVGTYIDRKQPYVNSFDINGLTFTEISNILMKIVDIAKPKKLIIDTFGIGRGVMDSIELLLLENDIKINHKNGKLKYSA